MSIRDVTSENTANGNFLPAFKSDGKWRASENQKRNCLGQYWVLAVRILFLAEFWSIGWHFCLRSISNRVYLTAVTWVVVPDSSLNNTLSSLGFKITLGNIFTCLFDSFPLRKSPSSNLRWVRRSMWFTAPMHWCWKWSTDHWHVNKM